MFLTVYFGDSPSKRGCLSKDLKAARPKDRKSLRKTHRKPSKQEHQGQAPRSRQQDWSPGASGDRGQAVEPSLPFL